MSEETIRNRRSQQGYNVVTSKENIEPTSKSTGWRVFIQILLTLVTVPLVYASYVTLFVEAPFEIKEVVLPTPPEWEGTLAENSELQRTEKLFHNQVHGPESIVFDQGHMYTGVYDGKVVHIESGVIKTLASFGAPPCGGISNEPNCGRPLGLRFDPDKYLVVLDAYKGLFRINVATGDVHTYFTSDIIIDGAKPKFLNDLDIDRDGMIYFSDSSTKWHRKQFINIFLEGENTGRVIKYDPLKNSTEVLMKGLHFANGVQLSRKKDYFLVCETALARIHRYYLKGPKTGESEIFAENLPGLPDNIRLSTSGGFWVGMAKPRRSDKVDWIDLGMQSMTLKRFLSKAFSAETILTYTARMGTGLIVQLNENGDVTRTLHDPTGTVISSASEIYDNNGILYIGSYKAPFIGKLDIRRNS